MDSHADSKVIPIFFPDISDDEIEAATAVLRSGWIGSGKKVDELESNFAKAVGAEYTISTNTGTSALIAAMWGLGVEAGQQVILPSFTFIADFQALRSLRCEPVFADIEPDYLTLDPDDVVNRITEKTAGIITVHHGGQLSDMTRLRKIASDAGIWLIEDCAHAAGSYYRGMPAGSLSDAACFSFNAVKNLASGDGGMLSTSSRELDRRASAFRSLGLDKDTWNRYGAGTDSDTDRWCYSITSPGMRLHMNDITAAIAGVQLRRLPRLNRNRRILVERYESAFAELEGIRTIKARSDTDPSWHMYTVLMENRDEFIDQLRVQGITIGVHYYPVHLYEEAAPYRVDLPVTEELWQKVTTFPLFPSMSEQQQQRVIEATVTAVNAVAVDRA